MQGGKGDEPLKGSLDFVCSHLGYKKLLIYSTCKMEM